MGGLKEPQEFGRTGTDEPSWASDETFGGNQFLEPQAAKKNPVLALIFTKINALKNAAMHLKKRWEDLGKESGNVSPGGQETYIVQLKYIDGLMADFYKIHQFYQKAVGTGVSPSASFNGNASMHKRSRSGSSQTNIFENQKVANLEEENRRLKEKMAALEAAQKKLVAEAAKHVGGTGSYLVTAATPPELESVAYPRARLALASFTKALAALIRDSKQGVNDSISILNILSPGSASVYNRMKFERPHHRKYVLESYISQVLFSGLENEAYTIDKNLGSLDVMDPEKFQNKSYEEYKALKSLKSTKAEELRNEHDDFFKFCYAKFREIFPEELERKLFTSTADHGDEFIQGHHPTTPFYEKHFSPLALSVWLLRLLMFSFNPVATIFRVESGAAFNDTYMKSVVDHTEEDSDNPEGDIDHMSEAGHHRDMEVGVMVMPGFRVGKNIIKSIVYLVPRV